MGSRQNDGGKSSLQCLADENENSPLKPPRSLHTFWSELSLEGLECGVDVCFYHSQCALNARVFTYRNVMGWGWESSIKFAWAEVEFPLLFFD